MLAAPQKVDENPDKIFVWTHYEDPADKTMKPLPEHVLEFSKGDDDKKTHYALVCRSSAPLALVSQPFDPACCRNPGGKEIGGRQVTALLKGDLEDPRHVKGKYHFGFRAALADPWRVKLVKHVEITRDANMFDRWRSAWCGFAASQRKPVGVD